MPKKTPQPKAPSFSLVARRIDSIANRLAVPWGAVANYPDELAAVGLEPEDVTPAAAREAYHYHRAEIRRLLDRAYRAGVLVTRH